jgi:circadian clock protein KaiC
MKDREIERKRKVLEAEIANLRAEFESVEDELNKTYIEDELVRKASEENREELLRMRKGDVTPGNREEI